MRRFGLVEACDDSELLAFPLWPAQRKMLAQVEAGPLLHVWACGRRSSKSTMMALTAVWCCLLRPELRDRLRPGERGYAIAVATNLKQARLLVQAAKAIVERSPLLGPLVESSTEDEIRFRNGTAFAAFPCSSRAGRGFPVFALLMDEAAHFLSETEGPQVADRVFEALIPATAQFGDQARVIVGSTPYGTDGFFAEMFTRAEAGELDDAVAVRAATREMNPTIDLAFLERQRQLDPESFKAEYEAEFLGSGGAFLDPEQLAEAVTGAGELPPEAARRWVAGLDPAFSSDPFGLAIVGRDPVSHRLVLGVARAWRPKRQRRSLAESRELEDARLDDVAQVCLRYGASVVTDQHRAGGVADYLRGKGLAVQVRAMTAQTSTATFLALRARLNVGGLELYDEPQLLAELRRLRTRYAAGSAAVVNPRVGGSHGDMAQALALAVAEHDFAGIRTGDPLLPALGFGGSRRAPRRWYDGPGDGLRERVF